MQASGSDHVLTPAPAPARHLSPDPYAFPRKTGWLLLSLLAAVPLALAGTMRSNQLGQNVLTYSERLENAVWVKSNSTATSSAAIAPDGTMTASTVMDNGTNGVHNVTVALRYRCESRDIFGLCQTEYPSLGICCGQ